MSVKKRIVNKITEFCNTDDDGIFEIYRCLVDWRVKLAWLTDEELKKEVLDCQNILAREKIITLNHPSTLG